MQSHTVWGGIETESSKDGDGDSQCSQSPSDGMFKRVPANMRSYLEQVDFRDNSSTSSHLSNDSSKRRLSQPDPVVLGAKPEVATFLKNRLQERMGDDSSSRGPPPGGDDEDYGSAAGVSDKDRQVFEQVIREVGLWSRGCAQHSSRRCRPCHYVHCKAGCSNGANCDFCHFPHTDKNRQRLGMAKRLYCKNIASLLSDSCGSDEGKFEQVVRASACMSSYLHGILLERLRERRGGAGLGPTRGRPPDGSDSHTGSFGPLRTNIVSL